MGFYLPDDEAERTSMIRNMNSMICEINPAWPHGIDHYKVYCDFLHAIESGHLAKPSQKPYAYGESFRQWSSQKNLRELYGTGQKELPSRAEQGKELTVEQVYAKETLEGLQHTHDTMVMLIQSDHRLAQGPKFYEQKRALVNELSYRDQPVNPILLR